MSKRLGEIYSNTPKKQKLDETFWDNDLDDDYFGEVASKILEQDELVSTQPTQGNISILPSYETFQPRIAFASTQNVTPAVSKYPHAAATNNEDVQMKLTYLEQKCESKEGEVSILRAQLQKLKSEMIIQQSNKYKEYLEKTNQKDKEIKSIRGQLEFKNLEIANLKQKVSDISKAAFNVLNKDSPKRPRIENSSVSNLLNSQKNIDKCDRVSNVEINILKNIDFPLLSKFPPSFFESSPPEIHVLESRTNQYGRNTIPYLHNQLIQEEFILPSGPKVTVEMCKKEVGLEHIFPDMLKIIKCNSEEINSTENKDSIKNVLSMSIQLLQHFDQYLAHLQRYYRTEDIEQMEKTFLQKNYSQYSCNVIEKNKQDGEIGIRAGKTVRFIAEVIPFNSYLADFILGKSFSIDRQNLGLFTNAGIGNRGCFFSLLCDTVRKIFLLRKTEVCYSFLNSVVTLLLNISRSHFNEKIYSLFNDLIGLLLLTRPPTSIVHKVLIIFKNCSTSLNFLEFLCKKPDAKKFRTDEQRKLQYFDEESCKFTLFVALYNNGLKNIEDEELCLNVAVNVLSFVYNIFMKNPSWIHKQEKHQCICLEQLYQIAIEVSYKSMLILRSDSQKRNKYPLFKSIISVIELLSFNSCNLMKTYDESYSKYQEICSIFVELQDDSILSTVNEQSILNISEEIPIVPASNFDLL